MPRYTSTNQRSRGSSGLLAFPVVAACFLLSGFAALLYQVVWLRQFGILFGTSELALVATLASYMSGLGIGAVVARQFLGNVSRPLRVYVALEGAIAVAALAMPHLIDAVEAALPQFESLARLTGVEPGAATASLYFLTAFLLMMAPTAMMGATLPVLLKFVLESDDQVGRRTSLLYAVNTAGAVLGVLVTAFLLLPETGLRQAAWVGVGANLLAAALAWQLPAPVRRAGAAPAGSGRPAPGRSPSLLLIMALSGIVSFSLEVTWTRLLGHVIGGSIYAFAVMLATFLLGIALGAGFAGRLATGPRRAWVILGAAEVAIGLLSLGTYFIMSTAVPGERSWASALVYAAAIMLPATVCIGATFPLAVRAAARTVEEAPAVAGGIYAANTAGAIAGAILTGLVLLPWIGFTGVARAASTTSIVLGVAMLTLLPGTGRPQQALGAILVLLVVLLPLPRPDAVINATSMRAGSTQGEELFYAVGRSATVMAKSFGGNITLRTNGLPEAAIATHGMPPMRNSQHWLGALPHFARPGAHSALVVGLGGGVVLEGIPPHAQGTLTVVELEREVLHANRVIEPYRRHAILDREGVRYVINDARSALLLDRNRYDVIISQPSHPWTAGASHLYTREFFQLVRTRLNPDGVFLQWIHSEFLDEALLRSLAATLLSQFSHVELFEPVPGVLEFLASSRPLDDSWLPSRLQRVLQRDSDHFKGIGISDPLDILAARVLSTAGVQALAAGAPVNTDNRNRLATASRSRGEGLSSEDLVRILGDNDTFCAGARPPQHHLALDEAFYVHRQWQLSGFVARSAHCTALAQGPLRVLSAAHALMVRGDRTKAVQLLTANGLLDGSTPDATYLASLLALAGQGSGELPPLEGLPPGAKATLAAWKAAQADEWETVRTLDKALSTTATHDTWFTDAAKLMSEWRIRQAVTMNSAAPLEVARAIIDSGLSVQWTEDLLILRIGVASMLRDGNLFLGSTQAYLSTLERRLEPARTAGPAAVPLDALTQKRLRGIAAQLAGLDALLPQAETRGITQRIDALLDAKPGGRS